MMILMIVNIIIIIIIIISFRWWRISFNVLRYLTIPCTYSFGDISSDFLTDYLRVSWRVILVNFWLAFCIWSVSNNFVHTRICRSWNGMTCLSSVASIILILALNKIFKVINFRRLKTYFLMFEFQFSFFSYFLNYSEQYSNIHKNSCFILQQERLLHNVLLYNYIMYCLLH